METGRGRQPQFITCISEPGEENRGDSRSGVLCIERRSFLLCTLIVLGTLWDWKIYPDHILWSSFDKRPVFRICRGKTLCPSYGTCRGQPTATHDVPHAGAFGEATRGDQWPVAGDEGLHPLDLSLSPSCLNGKAAIIRCRKGRPE